MARSRMLAACRTTPWALLPSILTKSYLKGVACKRVFALWAQEWQALCCKCIGQDSFAYEYTILQPPDGNNHPLWIGATSSVTDSDPNTGKRVPL